MPTPPICSVDVPENVDVTAAVSKVVVPAVASAHQVFRVPRLPLQESPRLAPKRRLFSPEDTGSRHVNFRSPPIPSASTAPRQQIDYVRQISAQLEDGAFRICECCSCVEHALSLRSTPPRSGGKPPGKDATKLLFVGLLSITGRRSTDEKRRELTARYYAHPEASRDACSCLFCVTHQVLQLAGRHARQLQYAGERPIYPAKQRSDRVDRSRPHRTRHRSATSMTASAVKTSSTELRR
jgi:hypothetical protein